MKIRQREILLVPFPFSDFSSKKVRPVLVLSKDNYNDSSEDIIVSAITSNISKDNYSILIISEYLEEGHLIGASSIKVENILRIDKKLLIKKIGKLNQKVFDKALRQLESIFR